MFTGIIEEQGIVRHIQTKKNLLHLDIEAKKIFPGTKIGDSIAIDGVCLTVTRKKQNHLTFAVMKETIRCTTFQHLQPSQGVNLERALKIGDRLGGHFVTGHIDTVGRIKKKIDLENYVEYQIQVPAPLTRFIVPKGSIAVDGISLTVGTVTGNAFSVYLIPHTLEVTNLKHKQVGDDVNVETDLFGKYVLKSRDSLKII